MSRERYKEAIILFKDNRTGMRGFVKTPIESETLPALNINFDPVTLERLQNLEPPIPIKDVLVTSWRVKKTLPPNSSGF